MLKGCDRLKKSSVDLTEGVVYKQLIVFAVPILLGQIFQNLYNSVDSIVVGRIVGKTALAAVSASADISNLLISFFTGLSTGAGVLFAKCFGAKEYDDLHKATHTAIAFSLILGVLLSAVGVAATSWLLRIVDCPADVFAEAEIYLKIYLFGSLFTVLYNVEAALLRSIGDSGSPFRYLVISSCANVVLDFVFVGIFKIGVAGAAAATVLSQLLSVVMATYKMLRTEDVYKLVLKDLRIDARILYELLRLGVPAAFQTSLISISNLFVQRYINAFGSSAIAGIGVAKKIDRFAGLASNSIGLSLMTFIGQNVGANKKSRAIHGLHVSLIICLIYVVIVGVPLYLFAPAFVRIFSTDAETVMYGVAMVQTMMPLYFTQVANNIYANAVRGFGKSSAVMILSLIGMVGVRQLFLAVSMNMSWDVKNIYYAYPISWAAAALLVILYYLVTIRRPGRE